MRIALLVLIAIVVQLPAQDRPTYSEVRKFLEGKTTKQVKKAYGEPDDIRYRSNSVIYTYNKLAVYDLTEDYDFGSDRDKFLYKQDGKHVNVSMQFNKTNASGPNEDNWAIYPYNSGPIGTRVTASKAPGTTHATNTHKYSEVRKYLEGKTTKQVRQTYGEPDVVRHRSNSVIYTYNKLAIYDLSEDYDFGSDRDKFLYKQDGKHVNVSMQFNKTNASGPNEDNWAIYPYNSGPIGTRVTASKAPGTTHATNTHKYSEVRKYLEGKTTKQVRQTYGEPDQVDYGNHNVIFTYNKLAVYDLTEGYKFGVDRDKFLYNQDGKHVNVSMKFHQTNASGPNEDNWAIHPYNAGPIGKRVWATKADK